MDEYIVGQPLVISLVFTNEVTGVLTDPDTVAIGVQLGVNAPEIFDFGDLITTGLGNWYLTYTPSAPGNYTVQVESTGAIIGVSDPVVFSAVATSIAFP